ncbi:hypothetical protein JXQ70_08490 [bacterium]|nr:hypothetical protein [bacterium]
MALLTALRFTPRSGAMAMDQESWFLRRRKTFFSDCFYSLLPENLRKNGLELYYGGIGHPSFHFEIVNMVRQTLEHKSHDTYWQSQILHDSRPIFNLCREVLLAFQQNLRKRIDNRLQFLYGFGTEAFVGDQVPSLNRSKSGSYPINQNNVKKRALAIIEGKESLGYGDLTVANEASLIGIDPVNGFSGFTMKERDGVLSFHSCGFEALGAGKYIAGAEFANLLNELSLSQRRLGMGTLQGIISLCLAIIKAGKSFGHVGGALRMVLLDADEKKPEDRAREIGNNRAQLLIEMVKAYADSFLPKEKLEKLITRLLRNETLNTLETDFFQQVTDFHAVEKMLRGYKKTIPGQSQSKILKQVYSASRT